MNLSKKTKILIIVLLVGLVAVFVAYKIAYKPHPETEDQEVAFKGEATVFQEQVSADATNWQNRYVELTGEATGKDDHGIMINGSVYCQFNKLDLITGVSEGSAVTIKGRFIGYDDLLEEIKLDKCIIK